MNAHGAALAILGIEWSQSAALWLLGLPILVLWLARLVARPRPLATGTLELWKKVSRPLSRGERRRGRVPPAVWMCAAALGAAALALAGPRTPPDVRRIRIAVDRSPSMYLPAASGTRIENACARAQEWLREAAGGAIEVEWFARAGGRLVSASAPAPPAAWLTPPRVPAPELEVESWDEPGTLLVTDRAPDPPPRFAGYVASGGEAIPGPIGVEGTTRFDFDGRGVVAVPGGAPARRVSVGGDQAEPLRAILRAWGDARGVAIEGEGTVVLEVRRAPPGESAVVSAGRDGWWAEADAVGRAASSDGEGELEAWLVAPGDQRALVSVGKGRIEVALASLREIGGDPAAFAVSWGSLFDRAALLPPGLVEMRERLAAGDPESRAPHAGSRATRSPSPAAAALAALAFLLAAGAFVLAHASRRTPARSITLASPRPQRARQRA
jgi:hypothetical protein